ncbi:tRNA (adenosine(37)-N6)-threonylcarbamoyltransferase complex transferase subunit TsaD [endosymbiont of Pachyrhynchus infernalis]|uniref:tRNA (adenosine(37)-N6)-threonylcarbamoyltransferase complex transferase subunit TsaD n=1 Tax=endosymbiont of Pachyrhynchus infernalis TaxID=1971488 RepID=UPI000DC6DE2B|nr:tRNA (adenosine(37)-N6)-threonylcarbamoyltransferase complex transferase subunit TsaD [endosymbiont of Pachyrhynchus infernalis]BBA84908.1 tRNA N6-adenosine threonylcarbamoyltransferase [endosymbiont of Pachyrhynchus infernalis]
MKILGIETSCDETGVSIYDSNNGVIFNKTYSSKKIHSKYGGVIPELASKNHIINIIKIINNIYKKNFYKNIDKIAYTAGPGLFSSLIIGATIGSTLAYSWNIDSIPINHLEGHILSPFIETNNIKFPFVSLLISGGNTQLIYSNKLGKYKIIGKTVDDAVGEVYDKIANILGINYPGGKEISNLAKYGRNIYKFPRPMINNNKYKLNFSFSGLKTHIYKLIKKNNNINYQTKCDIALEFENSVIDILLKKCELSIIKTKSKILTVSGGVVSNKNIRNKLLSLENKLKIKVLFPNRKYFTDNGAMIAYVGYLKSNIIKNNKLNIFVNNKWSLEDI